MWSHRVRIAARAITGAGIISIIGMASVQGCSSHPVNSASNDGGAVELDGGLDTGTALPDASALDGGATDAGSVDGGATDAGAADAGAADSGAADAGATDAGDTDAGAADAGDTDGGVADAGSVPGPVTDQEAIQFRIDADAATCGWLARCGLAATKSGCGVYFGTPSVEPWLQSLLAAKNDGRVVFDAAAFSACLTAIETSVPCATSEDLLRATPACLAAVRGMVATGGSCYLQHECSIDDYCSSTSTTCPGMCTPRKGVGQPASLQTWCQAGLYLYVADMTCRAPAAAGASCAPLAGTTRQSCAYGYHCGASSTCDAVTPLGAACNPQDSCAPLSWCRNGVCRASLMLGETCAAHECALDLTCERATSTGFGTCVSKAAGLLCWNSQDCLAAEYCQGATNTYKGTCSPRLTLGAPCTTSTNDCAAGLYCDGTCQPLKPGGTACTYDLECAARSCVAMTCAAKCLDPTP